MSQFGRVVKAMASKAVGFTRAGSNPAADFFIFFLFEYFNFVISIKSSIDEAKPKYLIDWYKSVWPSG